MSQLPDAACAARCALLALRGVVEWDGLDLAVLLEQYLDFAFGGIELLAARRGEAHAFFEEDKRLFEGKVSALELLDDLLELLQAVFEFGHRTSGSAGEKDVAVAI